MASHVPTMMRPHEMGALLASDPNLAPHFIDGLSTLETAIPAPQNLTPLPFNEYVAQLPRKRMSAGVLLYDDADRVVLVNPSYKEGWEIPGGAVEANEAPWQAASRELAEELGLVRERMRPLIIDHMAARDDGMPEGLAWIFDGGPVSEHELKSFRLGKPEILSVHLYRQDEVWKKLASPVARQLEIALGVVRHGTGFVLCDQGVPASYIP